MPSRSSRTSLIVVRIAQYAPGVVKRGAAVEEAHIIRLSIEDQRRFADLLLDPPDGHASLTLARESHERLIGEAR
jgi:hypothetical protein